MKTLLITLFLVGTLALAQDKIDGPKDIDSFINFPYAADRWKVLADLDKYANGYKQIKHVFSDTDTTYMVGALEWPTKIFGYTPFFVHLVYWNQHLVYANILYTGARTTVDIFTSLTDYEVGTNILYKEEDEQYKSYTNKGFTLSFYYPAKDNTTLITLDNEAIAQRFIAHSAMLYDTPGYGLDIDELLKKVGLK